MNGLCAAPARHLRGQIQERAVSASHPGDPVAAFDREVPAGLQALQTEVSDLASVVSELRTRLSPIIGSGWPSGGSGSDAPRPALCGVADVLYTLRESIQQQRESLAEILACAQV